MTDGTDRLASAAFKRLLTWLLVAVLMSGLCVLSLVLLLSPERFLDLGDKAASIVGAVVGLLGLFLGVWSVRLSLATVRLDRVQVLTLLEEELARLVRRQWEQEAQARGLTEPEPIRLVWKTGSTAIGRRAATLRRGARAGGLRHGDVRSLAGQWRGIGTRQLVIIGAPGAGKTSATVLLACQMLANRVPRDPVPVLLTVASWDLRLHMDTWLAEQLVAQYPSLRVLPGYEAGAPAWLVDNRRVVPLLDGLDEVSEYRRARVVAALKAAVGRDGPLVLTCRAEEYQQLVDESGPPLPHAAVVELQNVSGSQAGIYLSASRADPASRWEPVVRNLREQPDGPLATALTTPLMVFLARTAYRRPTDDPTELLRLADRNAIEERLLAGYVPAVYGPQPPARSGDQHRRPDYPIGNARRWLGNLARGLDRLQTRDLTWGQLERQIPRRLSLLWPLAGLIVAIGVGVLGGLITDARIAVVTAAAAGLTVALHPAAVELARPRGSYLAVALSLGTMLGVVAAAAATATTGSVRAAVIGLGAGVACGLVTWMLGAAAISLAGVTLGVPGRRLMTSAETAFFGTVAGITIMMLAGASATASVHDLVTAGATAIGGGLLAGLVAWLISGRLIRRRPIDARFLLQFGRLQAFAFGSAVALLFGLSAGLAVADTANREAAVRTGTTVGIATGVAAIVVLPWGRFAVARCWLALGRALPWRLIRFLEDANDRGVLRQVGQIWQFRHARLHDHLSSGGPTRPNTRAC